MPACFVVMGFGKKTDYPTGRVLDLDKSYKYIIKPAAEAAGYVCIRADEIQHSGNINVPMYQQLLNADVVIADVSTYNANAFYELGVRHALKPYTTITIAEDKLVFPFDVRQIAIRTYHHLGEGIDFGEVERMRGELQKAIKAVGAQAACDSPVYTFMKDLQPPAIAKAEAERAALAANPSADAAARPTVRALMDQVEAAFERSDFITAKSLLTIVRSMMPNDVFVIQKLALAAYRSKLPTPVDALNEACQMLEALEPRTSTDAETLGLYGAIRKRLWEATQASPHLDKAIWAHEKGFYLRNDHYNGINLAYLLNLRASISSAREAIADTVVAERVRRRVSAICEELLRTPIRDDQGKIDREQTFWVRASLIEALFGAGEAVRANELRASVVADAPEQWMADTMNEQLANLQALLAAAPAA